MPHDLHWLFRFRRDASGRRVAWAQGAYVNRVLVNLLHPLQSGDIIQIEVGPILQKELPKGWEEKPGEKLRYATFVLDSKGPALELSVTHLGQGSGELLPNVPEVLIVRE